MSRMRLQSLQCLLLAARIAVGIGGCCVLYTGVVQAGATDSPELVKVEGRRVEAAIEGTGSAAVVFESGFNGSSLWGPIQSQIAQKTVTLSYQRAGLGRSDPGSNPRSAGSSSI